MATEFQKNKWANMFKMFDVNGDGQIEQSDLDQFHDRLFKMRGIGPGSAQYEELNGRFAQFGQALKQVTKVETLTMADWLAFWTNVASSPEMYQIVRPTSEAIFGLWDLNGDGQVSLQEYRKLCTVMRLGEGYADDMFAKLDLNQDGNISTEELMKLSDQYFVGDDPNAPGNLFFGPL
ncbi:MAG: EF-hand domain-containing protein [Anaerolineales bacterium]|nr:EF-hand domain-containing protein [Anaerolineales bacterium]